MGQRAIKSTPSPASNTRFSAPKTESPVSHGEGPKIQRVPPPSRSIDQSTARSTHQSISQPSSRSSFSNGRTTSSSQHLPPGLPHKYDSPSSTVSKLASLEKFFLKYKDEGEDAILAEGMEKFCIDLGVEPTDFIVLLIAWRFKASEMCRFSREEFINGCQRLRAHDTRTLRQRFPELIEETKMERNFKDLYQFTFSFGLDHSAGQRSLPVDMAVALWELVFSQKRPPVLDKWFDYLQQRDIRSISRDTWNMFLPFVATITADFKNYDESEAWPSLFDDFVEYELEKNNS